MRSVRFAIPVDSAPLLPSDGLRRVLLAGCLVAGAGLALTASQGVRQGLPPPADFQPTKAKTSRITISSLASALPRERRMPAAAAPPRPRPAASEPTAVVRTPPPAPTPAMPARPLPQTVPIAPPLAPAAAAPVAPAAARPESPVPPTAAVRPPESTAATPVPLRDSVVRMPLLAAPASVRPLVIQLPVAAARAPVPRPAPPVEPTDAAAIEQIAGSDAASAFVPQLAPGEPAGSSVAGLAFAADMSQLPAPAALSREQRTALLTEAPAQLSLIVDGRRLGDVAIRMTDATTVEVQLAGLLDLLSHRFDAQEYAALRGAAAADTFVSFDQLHAAGIDLHYDPVYDELTLSA